MCLEGLAGMQGVRKGGEKVREMTADWAWPGWLLWVTVVTTLGRTGMILLAAGGPDGNEGPSRVLWH